VDRYKVSFSFYFQFFPEALYLFNKPLITFQVPTIGFNCEKIRALSGKAKGTQFLVWDVGKYNFVFFPIHIG